MTYLCPDRVTLSNRQYPSRVTSLHILCASATTLLDTESVPVSKGSFRFQLPMTPWWGL